MSTNDERRAEFGREDWRERLRLNDRRPEVGDVLAAEEPYTDSHVDRHVLRVGHAAVYVSRVPRREGGEDDYSLDQDVLYYVSRMDGGSVYRDGRIEDGKERLVVQKGATNKFTTTVFGRYRDGYNHDALYVTCRILAGYERISIREQAVVESRAKREGVK